MAAPRPTDIAACDSMVLMWALPWGMRPEKKKKKNGTDVPLMRKRAKILLRHLEELNIELFIPSIVVSELLAGVDVKNHPKLLAEMSKRFFCPPLDLKAAALAARLWQSENDTG